jgi:hypothetical protein
VLNILIADDEERIRRLVSDFSNGTAISSSGLRREEAMDIIESSWRT